MKKKLIEIGYFIVAFSAIILSIIVPIIVPFALLFVDMATDDVLNMTIYEFIEMLGFWRWIIIIVQFVPAFFFYSVVFDLFTKDIKE